MTSPNLAEISVRLESLPAENNKNIYGQFNLFRMPSMRDAKATLDLFDSEKRGKPIFSAPFTPRWIAESREIWNEFLTKGDAGQKEAYPVFKSSFKDGKRTSEMVGQLVYGLDKGGMPYIGVTMGSDAYKLPLRPDPGYGRRDDYPPHLLVRAGIRSFLSMLDRIESIVTQSMLVPAEKQEGQGGGGGWKGKSGGGGGWNKGGNGGGGGNWKSGSGGWNNKGSAPIDDDDVSF